MAKGGRVIRELNELVLDVLGDGFRVDAGRSTWNERDGVVHVLSVERGKHNASEFTLSWGVSVPGCYGLLYGREEPESLRHDECAVFGRLGALDDPPADPWWDVTQLDSSAPEIRSLLAKMGRFFTDLDDLPSLTQTLIDMEPRRLTSPRLPRARKTVQAALLALGGQRDEATRLVHELLLEGAAPPGAEKRIKALLSQEKLDR